VSGHYVNLTLRASTERPPATTNFWSVPGTSVAIYTGRIADTLALKGLGAHSTRLQVSSKKPRS
jgi:hypothetical protein